MENQTSLEPKQLITDTAGYSDIVFALFWLLGFQFSPRLADIGESRFWRLDRTANYGALNGLASHRVNPKLITQNWDDFLRVAGSLKMGKVSASELIRALQRGSKRSLLGRALGELGRIPKTLHLLTFIDDPCYRRSIQGTRQIGVILYAKEPSFPCLGAETWPRSARRGSAYA